MFRKKEIEVKDNIKDGIKAKKILDKAIKKNELPKDSLKLYKAIRKAGV